MDSGLPCTCGAGQRFLTQRERTAATELCAKTFLSLPFLIGYDYFMWRDEPPEGLSDNFPEDTNYGLVDVNDEITIRERSAESEHFKALREGTSKPIPKWITLDSANLKATVIAAPARDDIDLTIQENLIVELYSR